MSRIIFFIVFTLLLSTSISAKEIAGIDIPPTFVSNGQALTLNGAGARTKFFIKVYVASLYLSEKSTDGNAIIQSKEAGAIALTITSGLVNKKKMVKAIDEGFENATGGNTTPIQTEIDQFKKVFDDGVDKKDQFVFSYSADAGTAISKNGTQVTTINGDAFKRALFGIWLSDNPAQKSLKKQMLGN